MMNGERDKDANQIGPMKNPRQDRLKRALRENLKRRKSQSRGRSQPEDMASDAGIEPADGVSPDND